MLTTFDNPYDPFTNFDRWWKEDLRLGHDCCGTLARNAMTSEVFSDEVNQKIINEAMKEIVELEPMIYKLVSKDSDGLIKNYDARQ